MFFRSLLFLTCMLIQHSGAQSSCKELKTQRPDLEDGLYTLRASHAQEHGEEYQTYCDMTSDGGGWTLIASIHENNLKGKCTVGDNWSSQQGNKYNLPGGDSNWSNRKTFGHIVSVTEDDYKNPGYYDIDAASLAVWHVPNKTPMHQWKDLSLLRYHTHCSAWEEHGPNLFQLFTRIPVKHGMGRCQINNGPSISIEYDQGDDDVVRSLYGTATRVSFETGYISFRAINTDRSAFAICSGTKPTGCKPENHCVGGGGYVTLQPNCGDFSRFDDTDATFKASTAVSEAALLLFYN